MPDDAPPPEATLQITIAELDAILEEARPSDDPETVLEAAQHAGQVQAAEHVHHATIEAADIIPK